MKARIEVTTQDGVKHLLAAEEIIQLTKPHKDDRAVGKKCIVEVRGGTTLVVREGYRWIKAQLKENE